jgi:hypothetical protein
MKRISFSSNYRRNNTNAFQQAVAAFGNPHQLAVNVAALLEMRSCLLHFQTKRSNRLDYVTAKNRKACTQGFPLLNG